MDMDKAISLTLRPPEPPLHPSREPAAPLILVEIPSLREALADTPRGDGGGDLDVAGICEALPVFRRRIATP